MPFKSLVDVNSATLLRKRAIVEFLRGLRHSMVDAAVCSRPQGSHRVTNCREVGGHLAAFGASLTLRQLRIIRWVVLISGCHRLSRLLLECIGLCSAIFLQHHYYFNYSAKTIKFLQKLIYISQFK